MYMYIKPSLGDLNLSSYTSHLTSTYICRMTIALKVCGVAKLLLFAFLFVARIQIFPIYITAELISITLFCM